MIHVYKLGGKWKKKDGTEYTAKAIQNEEANEYRKQGWTTDINEIKTPKKPAKTKKPAKA